MDKKRGFLVIAHGSNSQETNEKLFTLVKHLKNYFHNAHFEPAMMKLAAPSIEEAINALIGKGVNEIVVFPFFLFRGVHCRKDVPDMIEGAIQKTGKQIPIIMLPPIGDHPAIFDLAQEMIYQEVMENPMVNNAEPSAMEDRSLELIDLHIDQIDMETNQKSIIKRVIHSTGDFDFLNNLLFSKGAIQAGIKAIFEQRIIYTDVPMLQAGINKRFSQDVKCVLNDPGIASGANDAGKTKPAYAMEQLGNDLNDGIVAIGNDPAALISLIEMVEKKGIEPALIVGIPAGFLNAKESKALLAQLKGIPFITNQGHKGGSTVVAAIINALITLSQESTP